MTTKPAAPCLECKERHESCHSSCEKYISFVKEHKLWSDKVKEARSLDIRWNDNITKRRNLWLNDQKRSWKRRR